jgi:hypothetical protein
LIDPESLFFSTLEHALTSLSLSLNLQVHVTRATQRGAVAPLIANQAAMPGKEDNNGEYSFNFFSAKPEPGVYDVEYRFVFYALHRHLSLSGIVCNIFSIIVCSITPDDNKYAAVTTIRTVKLSTSAIVSELTITVQDRDSDKRTFVVAPNTKADSTISVDSSQSVAFEVNKNRWNF